MLVCVLNHYFFSCRTRVASNHDDSINKFERKKIILLNWLDYHQRFFLHKFCGNLFYISLPHIQASISISSKNKFQELARGIYSRQQSSSPQRHRTHNQLISTSGKAPSVTQKSKIVAWKGELGVKYSRLPVSNNTVTPHATYLSFSKDSRSGSFSWTAYCSSLQHHKNGRGRNNKAISIPISVSPKFSYYCFIITTLFFPFSLRFSRYLIIITNFFLFHRHMNHVSFAISMKRCEKSAAISRISRCKRVPRRRGTCRQCEDSEDDCANCQRYNKKHSRTFNFLNIIALQPPIHMFMNAYK